MKISIVGAGLIGTSMGLGLKGSGHEIAFADIDPSRQRIAQDLVGPSFEGLAELVVIATPVEAQIESLKRAFDANPQAMFIDISGLKSELLDYVENFSELAKRFVATHPMAGREISGPAAARADLFEGRTWIVTPTSRTQDDVLDRVITIIDQLGASSVTRSAHEHDHAIALVSHLPQVMSSLTAAALVDQNQKAIDLAGQGLRDVSRLADSPTALWKELLIRNKEELLPILSGIKNELGNIIDAIQNSDARKLEDILIKGNTGRSLIPGKHGGANRNYFYLPIVIEDKPGQLAKIVDECAQAEVNIEDLSIEHSPGQETGLITLALSKEDADVLYAQLVQNGWRVHEAFTL